MLKLFIGVEFYAESIIGISQGSYFKTGIIVDDTYYPEAQGLDVFEMDCVLLQDYRIGGSGREVTYGLNNLAAGLGTLVTREAKEVKVERTKPVLVSMETNIFKDPNEFKEKLGIKVITTNGKTPIIPLNSSILAVKRVNDKEVLMDVTPLVKDLLEKIS